MDELVYKSLDNYFNRIKATGYVPYNNVYALIVLLYIYHIKETYILNEKEMGIVNDALACIRKSNCIIPYN